MGAVLFLKTEGNAPNMFRTNPRQLIERIVRNTFGFSARPHITARRIKEHEMIDGASVKPGDYVVELTIDGNHICRSVSRSWRKAYDSTVVSLKKHVHEKQVASAVKSEAPQG